MIISLHITPKAKKSEIIGWGADAKGRPVLKVKVAAQPEDGKANAELLRFLAKEWNIAKGELELVGGESSRNKRLKIHNVGIMTRLLPPLS